MALTACKLRLYSNAISVYSTLIYTCKYEQPIYKRCTYSNTTPFHILGHEVKSFIFFRKR